MGYSIRLEARRSGLKVAGLPNKLFNVLSQVKEAGGFLNNLRPLTNKSWYVYHTRMLMSETLITHPTFWRGCMAGPRLHKTGPGLEPIGRIMLSRQAGHERGWWDD